MTFYSITYKFQIYPIDRYDASYEMELLFYV